MEILQNIMLLFCGQCLNMIIFRKEIFGKKEDEELKKEIIRLNILILEYQSTIDFFKERINKLKGGKK